MTPLPIRWQRLVTADGGTCTRCGGTGAELAAAMEKLAPALAPLGVAPVLEAVALDPAAFAAAPSESNRIWIAGRPLEDWLDARVGSSRCCPACGGAECRTLSVDQTVHETVPAALIVRAALLAASDLLRR